MARRSKAWRGGELTRAEVTYRSSPTAQAVIAEFIDHGEAELSARTDVDLTPLATRPEIEGRDAA